MAPGRTMVAPGKACSTASSPSPRANVREIGLGIGADTGHEYETANAGRRGLLRYRLGAVHVHRVEGHAHRLDVGRHRVDGGVGRGDGGGH
jgi:hypothetical protein